MQQTASQPDALLDPNVLNRVGHLDILSRTVVDGLLSGKHRSTQKGGTFEFAEHRPYSAGDELRLIDWRIFAKRDRYYIKQFDHETNLQAIMVVDASGSMEFGMSTVSKLDYAKSACACLSRLMLRQRDAVGLRCFSGSRDQFIPPRGLANHLQPILEALRRLEASGKATLAECLFSLGRRLKRRGMIMVFSDCFGDLEKVARALKHLRLRGHELILFHVLAPEELTFSFTSASRFECLETAGVRLDLDPDSIRRAYLERMNAFLDELTGICARIQCEYVRLTTDQALADTLSYYLRLRASKLN